MQPRPTDQATERSFEYEDIEAEILDSLPLLNRFRQEYPSKTAFEDVHALFMQHHLGPFIPRLRGMEGDGLDYEKCWFVDIPYSTNSLVWKELRKFGCREEHAARRFNDPLKPYAQVQLNRVQRLIKRLIAEERIEKLLVVDDGAYFIRAVQELPEAEKGLLFGALKGRVSIVEQTTRGHRALKEKKHMKTVFELGAPCVSVARSYTKFFLEAPLIGEAVSRAIRRGIEQFPHKKPDSLDQILVIGYGDVGAATTHELRLTAPEGAIDVLDVDPLKRKAIRGESGLRAISRIPDPGSVSYDLVVGCTGYASFPLEARSLLGSDALLASGSSGAVELNRRKFIEHAIDLPDDDLMLVDFDPDMGVHTHLTFRQEDVDFSFLNAGFPINFDGSLESIPARMIQPTHGLMFAACRQALRSAGPGLSFLNFTDDFWLYEVGKDMIEAETK